MGRFTSGGGVMSCYVGISSACAPKLTGAELAELTRTAGGDVVDLRAGKGQRWEADGLAPFRAASLEIAFVGIEGVLGDERFSPATLSQFAEPYAGLPLKLFARAGCMRGNAAAQTRRQVGTLASLAGGARNVLIETHHGYAAVDELLALHEATGACIVLDLFGMARLEAQPLEGAERLATIVRVVQVKGFDWDAPSESRHLPLASIDLRQTKAMLAYVANHAHAVTVETRAGSAVEDLQVLRTVLSDI